MKYFVFLKLEDREIVNLFLCLRAIFMGRQSTTSIHVTIRGPYNYMIPESKLLEWQEKIAEEPIFITNVSTFSNPEANVVVLDVVNDRFSKVWWKPDYPVAEFGRNPHITIYEGSDKSRFEAIYEFMKSEELALRCDKFNLYCHLSKAADLFEGISISTENRFQGLVNLGKVKYDILERAMSSINEYKFADYLPKHVNPYK